MPRSYIRAEPDARRQSLIEAAARVLAERGASGASVRVICAEAGVSPGLLRHYFDGIDALIADAYRWTDELVGKWLDAAMAAAGPEPRARLLAYVPASFRAPIADPNLLATWIAFWSLARSNPEMGRLHGEIYAGYRAEIEALLAACGVPTDRLRLTAVGITALVDGLWLELCLAPDTFSAEEASAIAESWVENLTS
jgi:TetR/AcrR family transcriptional repressor of bet genes